MATVRSSQLLAKLELEDLELRWFGHVERSSGAVRTAYDIEIYSSREAQANMEETDRERLLT